VEAQESPGLSRRSRAAIVATSAVLVLGLAWFAWRAVLAPVQPAAVPSPSASNPSPESGAVLVPAPVFVPPFRVAHYRDGGQPADVEVYRRFDGHLCVRLLSRSFVSCDVIPAAGTAIRLAFADWVYLDQACCRFGIFLVGTVTSDVARVQVGLGSGRQVTATVVTLPSALEEPTRVFVVEQATGLRSLNHRLPVTALDDRDHELGRTSYLVEGG
jgi:hypothetical protein